MHFLNEKTWGKAVEFFGIAFGSAVIAFIVSGGENYERGFQIGAFLFVVYYTKDFIVDGLNSVQERSAAARFGSTVGVFLTLYLVSMLLSWFLLMITNADPCRGWARSEEYCAISEIREQYAEEPSYNDY
ncbi:MAG: hypothetical protein WAX57_01240 [Minisyncoccia bacterium]